MTLGRDKAMDRDWTRFSDDEFRQGGRSLCRSDRVRHQGKTHFLCPPRCVAKPPADGPARADLREYAAAGQRDGLASSVRRTVPRRLPAWRIRGVDQPRQRREAESHHIDRRRVLPTGRSGARYEVILNNPPCRIDSFDSAVTLLRKAAGGGWLHARPAAVILIEQPPKAATAWRRSCDAVVTPSGRGFLPSRCSSNGSPR